jgi:hypothetical protein
MTRFHRTLVLPVLLLLGGLAAGQLCDDHLGSSLFPGPDLDANGDGEIQIQELAVIHKVVPQFILVSADDNGFLAGLEWLEEQAHGHGFWGKVAFFITSSYRNAGPSHTGGDLDACWQRLARANAIGVHSRTHLPGGTSYSPERWQSEQGGCQTELMQVLQAPSGSTWRSYLWGSRAPYLQYNDAYFEVLRRIPVPVTYDSSIEATDLTWGVSMPFYRAPWPFTMDQGIPPGCRTSLLPPHYTENIAISRHHCIWEIPIYQYMWKGRWSSPFDINLWSPGSFGLDPAGEEVRELFRYNLDLHLNGNRAPFTIGVHSQNLTPDKPAVRELYAWLFDEIDRRIAAGEPWLYVSILELIDYLSDETPPEIWFQEEGDTLWRGHPREIRLVTDTPGCSALLRFRLQGELETTEVEMVELGGGVLTGQIPALTGRAARQPLEVDVVARDLRGNQCIRPVSGPRLLRPVARDPDAPRISLDVTPEQPLAAGLPVTLDARRSADPTSELALVTWDLDPASDADGDGDPGNDPDRSGEVITLPAGLEEPGIRPVRVTVTDGAGNLARRDLYLLADRWAWSGTFAGWVVATEGPSGDRLVAEATRDLQLGLSDAWWFTAGSVARATHPLTQPPGRVVIAYSATIPEQARCQVRLGNHVVDLPAGHRELELTAEDPEAREVELSFSLHRTVETRVEGHLRVHEITIYPRP